MLGLITKRVSASGLGTLQSASRGSLTIEQIDEIPEIEQTALFTIERVPITELVARQGIVGPQGGIQIVPDDVPDAELDAFLDELLK